MSSVPNVEIEDVIGSDGRRLRQGDKLSARQIGHHTDRMHASCIGSHQGYDSTTAVAAFKVEQVVFCSGSNDPRGERVVGRRTHRTGRDHVVLAGSG